MLSRSPFPQFIAQRVDKALKRLATEIWTEIPGQLAVMQTQPTADHKGFKEAVQQDFTAVTRFPHHWGRAFDQCWWRIGITCTAGNPKRYLRWRDQGEATVYVDGTPYYGIDSAHQYCPLPENVNHVFVESLCANTGIWVPGVEQGLDPEGARCDGATLATRDDDAWHAYHDMDVLLRVVKTEHGLHCADSLVPSHEGYGHCASLARTGPLVRKLLHRLEVACDVYDREGATALREALKAIYREFRSDGHDPKCILTGHAHIDLVWLWPERAGEFKAVHTFSTVNRLMETYPEICFGYSQPGSYEAIECRAPELMSSVRERIGEGNWEAIGAMYVEGDTQLPCGEALAMNFAQGQEGFRELTGSPSKVLWLPDVFGYSGCLPQLMRSAGVEYFFTQKLLWNSANRFPFSSFVWRGSDGSEVVSHVMLTGSYNSQVVPEELRDLADTHGQVDVHPEILVPTGYGDGGGGPTEANCERARRLGSLAGVPPVEWGRIDAFFDRLGESRDSLPVWSGEIYLEYHRGVQTTHGDLKASFRNCERALQIWEAERVVLGGGPIKSQVWKRLIFAHFHDFIPGSSIQEVYDEGIAELEAIAEEAMNEVRQELATGGSENCLFNPLPYPRNAVRNDKLVRLEPLAGLPIDKLTPADDIEQVKVTINSLDNGRVHVEFDERGQISKLFIDGKSIHTEERLAQLVVFPDRPSNFEAWEVERHTLSMGQRVESPATRVVEEGSALRGAIAFTREITPGSTATIRYILEAGASVLKVEYEIDWQDPETLLKLLFPTQYQGMNARYGAPFGSTLRAQQPGDARAEAMWEVPGSRYAMVCDDAASDGLFVVTEAKYGFGCQTGLLHVTLLRSAFVSNADIDRPLRDVHKDHDFSDIGKHTVRLAIGRYHPQLPREEQPAALADLLYTHPIEYTGKEHRCPFRGIEGGSSLQPCWAKPQDADGMILRLHETLGCRGNAKILVSANYECTPVNLLGEPIAGPLGENILEFGPYQMISLRILRRRN